MEIPITLMNHNSNVRACKGIGTLLGILLLAGCVSTQKPTNSSERGTLEPSRQTAEEQRQTDQRPADITPPSIAQPRNIAAQTLLAKADTAMASKQPATAIILLERAVRIEPRESLLWIRLSRAHLDQADTQAAFQHARKAIALAGSDKGKTREAWLQLAEVYAAQGKESDARQIRHRYRRGSG